MTFCVFVNIRCFVKGDIDGFFGLFIDNLLQLMLIAVLCPLVCGFPVEMVIGTILPGAALSVLVGNLFYSYQAYRLAKRTQSDQVTALPYGINTVSLIAFIFLIMGPIYRETGDAKLAWKAGLFACFLSGVIECIGAFIGGWVRKHTPRAALLSSLAGVAITFISMGFVFQIFASPAVAIIPMFLIVATYASGTKLPFHLPAGMMATFLGIGLGWILRFFGWSSFAPFQHPMNLTWYPPQWAGSDVFFMLTDPLGWKYMSVIIPMSLFNIIGSLQNLESAEAAKDCYSTKSSMIANGIGGLSAAFFGSPFPTTIYIGHPGWKAMGARIGYSALNGIVISFLILFGGISLVLNLVPLEATLGILLWVGLAITAQAFQAVPSKHALAVSIGLVPCLASWALLLVETSLRAAGSSLFSSFSKFGNDLYVSGLIHLNQGFLFTAMILSATLVYVIEREFIKAAVWMLVASLFSFFGLMHAYSLTEAGLLNHFAWMAAPQFAIAYLGVAGILASLHYLNPKRA